MRGRSGGGGMRASDARRAELEDTLVRNQILLERAFPENSPVVDQQFQRGYEDGVGGFGFRERLADGPELVAAYCYGYVLGKFA